MSETQTPYLYNAVEEEVANVSFTLNMLHIGMISDLVQRGIGKNKSAVVRQAIEKYYRELTPEAQPA